MNLILVLHNIRSIYNVGAILRTAACFDLKKVIVSGYTPHPEKGLPHERQSVQKSLQKTSLGAEKLVQVCPTENITKTLQNLQKEGYSVAALEQDPTALPLRDYSPPRKLALILGEEVHGVPPDLLPLASPILEIPLPGKKESLNVSTAAAIAIWELISTLDTRLPIC